MPQVKKLLIVSCSTGSGHFRAAESLRLTCQKLYPDIQVSHIDMADYLDGIAYIYVVSFYNFFSKFVPFSYKFVYHTTDKWFIHPLFKALAPIIRVGSRKFIKAINDFGPDLIISTHFLPPLILPKTISVPIDTIVTDYHAHKIWLPARTRNIFVATEEIQNNLADHNIKSIVSGIPIHPDFFAEKNIDQIKTKFNIKNNEPVILLMPTSKGNIRPEEAVHKIFNKYPNKNINIIAIAGKNNKKNFANLEALKAAGLTNFTVLKNVENIDELMKIADVIVGKAGGLTISEAMYLQKPIIVINPIPGQEDYNTNYLKNNHYGLQATCGDDLTEKLQTILANPALINKKIYPDPSKIILEKTLA